MVLVCNRPMAVELLDRWHPQARGQRRAHRRPAPAAGHGAGRPGHRRLGAFRAARDSVLALA
jgi:hypothetical protein